MTDRIRFTLTLFLFFGVVITLRLFYWQIISGSELAALADSQHSSLIQVPSQRGKIITSDGFSLVSNQPAYLTYAYLPQFTEDIDKAAFKLAQILAPEPESTTASAKLTRQLIENTEATIASRLANQNVAWTPLARKITPEQKAQVEALGYSGIGFENESIRFYPEASMSAHLLGFVGSDQNGLAQGYFGLEGFYNLELRGRAGIIRQEKDATGKPILVGGFGGFESKNGRNLVLYLDRSVQRIVEAALEEAIKRYGAKSGEVLIMEPATGGIIASASFPHYDPSDFSKFDNSLFKNPAVADSYEPGSTFKVLVVAAALDEGVVEPDTKCDICEGPLTIGEYTISTWNQKYNPGITTTEIIQYSDNVGMVFVGRKIGKEKLHQYLTNFGIGQPTGIDLEEETTPQLRPWEKWGDIHLATTSFGQGVAVTGVQMLTAVSAIANGGKLMQPQVVHEIQGATTVSLNSKQVRQVISPETAEEMTRIMVNAVTNGEAQWTKIKGYQIAGKTGTAQVAIAGNYDEEKTIASFVGFAPADKPKFAMLVKLREPTTSPWAAETAAPLWTSIARKLFLYYGIPPDS